MKHLEAAYNNENSGRRYLLVVFLIFLAQALVVPIGLLCRIHASVYLDSMLRSMEALSVFASKNAIFLGTMFPFLLLIPIFALLVWIFHSRSIITVINGTNRMRWGRIFAGFAAWFVISIVLEVIGYMLHPENYTLQFNLHKFIPLLLLSLFFIPLQASFEELVMRGYIMQGVGSLTHSRWIALLVSSLFFAALHMFNPEIKVYGYILFFNYLAMALVWAFVSLLDDGIELAMGMHIANNLFICLFTTQQNAAFETDAVFEVGRTDPQTSLLVLIISSALVIIFFYKKYNWKFSIMNQKIEKPGSNTSSVS